MQEEWGLDIHLMDMPAVPICKRKKCSQHLVTCHRCKRLFDSWDLWESLGHQSCLVMFYLPLSSFNLKTHLLGTVLKIFCFTLLHLSTFPWVILPSRLCQQNVLWIHPQIVSLHADPFLGGNFPRPLMKNDIEMSRELNIIWSILDTTLKTFTLLLQNTEHSMNIKMIICSLNYHSLSLFLYFTLLFS